MMPSPKHVRTPPSFNEVKLKISMTNLKFNFYVFLHSKTSFSKEEDPSIIFHEKNYSKQDFVLTLGYL